MAHDVPLGGVDQVDLEVAVAELVHEVLELHELVPGAADAHQEDGVVALLVHAVGQRGHPLAGLVDVPAVLEVALLVEVHDLDLLGLLHSRSFHEQSELSHGHERACRPISPV